MFFGGEMGGGTLFNKARPGGARSLFSHDDHILMQEVTSKDGENFVIK